MDPAGLERHWLRGKGMSNLSRRWMQGMAGLERHQWRRKDVLNPSETHPAGFCTVQFRLRKG